LSSLKRLGVLRQYPDVGILYIQRFYCADQACRLSAFLRLLLCLQPYELLLDDPGKLLIMGLLRQ
jgi:hypothetical protein